MGEGTQVGVCGVGAVAGMSDKEMGTLLQVLFMSVDRNSLVEEASVFWTLSRFCVFWARATPTSGGGVFGSRNMAFPRRVRLAATGRGSRVLGGTVAEVDFGQVQFECGTPAPTLNVWMRDTEKRAEQKDARPCCRRCSV